MAEERDRGGELGASQVKSFTVQLGTRRMHDARSSSSARIDSRPLQVHEKRPSSIGRRSMGKSQNLHSGSWLAVETVLPTSRLAQLDM